MDRLDPRIAEELAVTLKDGLANGQMLTPAQLEEQLGAFRSRFDPAILAGLDGDALLQLLHGRVDPTHRSLAYWLEFKNDEEFQGHKFGRIGGGSALKFGLYQRSDAQWMSGSPIAQRVISRDEAVQLAREQRDQLVAGASALRAMNLSDTSDAAYLQLQAAMEQLAPRLCRESWARKYWFLIFSDRLDDFHSPRHQRFHLLKVLQMPPDGVGVLDQQAGRFLCAGRYVSAAAQLGVPVTTLASALNQRDGFHRYWKIGTTSGSEGTSQWHEMRNGGFVSIGWAELGDLSSKLKLDTPRFRAELKAALLPGYGGNASTASRKAGEVLSFAVGAAEQDLVVACEGQTVLGVGRLLGPYEYDGHLRFPHTRRVEWLSLEEWTLPEREALQTTFAELGRSAQNLLTLETHLHAEKSAGARPVRADNSVTLKPLDPFDARVEAILKRKGQAVFYGPPGTGKTHRALRLAEELAARQAFGKSAGALTPEEKTALGHYVRLCTFHPGWSYEDFVEGLRPTTIKGAMVFEPRDGTFKCLCNDAAREPGKSFFLIIDELNRGDIPRIFGELMTIIELDKRSLSMILPVTRASFSVPPNVFLLATMNTADRSISLMDAALRRRFGFVELMPDSSLLAGRTVGTLRLGAWLDALNARLRRCLKRDARNLQIGHAYLMSSPITSVAEFARVLRDDIVPLLEEYCYDDFAMLKDILGPDLVDVEAGRIKEALFSVNREADLIQALSYEEMQPMVLDQPSVDDQDSDVDEPPLE